MRVLEVHNCADYLREADLICAGESVSVQHLAGGVSNVVFYVQRDAGDDFVLKQAREQLRVEQPWFCSVERIWREVEVLRICRRVLQADLQRAEVKPGSKSQATVCIPDVLFEDRENYVFTMTAAPDGHLPWKDQLLAGEFTESIATACGKMLGRLHAETWNDVSIAEQLGDREYFMQLRVDPYYRRVAEVRADLADDVDELIGSLDENRRCLVHGDFSPKNLLVWDSCQQDSTPSDPNVMLIDCEVGHFGDPAFDLGFFLSHLVLKSVFHARQAETGAEGPLALSGNFWSAYGDILECTISPEEFDVLQQRAAKNLAGCLAARVDGKSPVEYLPDNSQQETVRELARRLFRLTPCRLEEALNLVGGMLRKG